MNLLPSIELVTFLNWIDINRIVYLPIDQTIEEYLLDYRNHRQVEELASKYLEKRANEYPNTPEGRFKTKLDLVLRDVRQECITNNDLYYYRTMDCSMNEVIRSVEFALQRIKNDGDYDKKERLCEITPESLADSLLYYIREEHESALQDCLDGLAGSSANIVKDFWSFFSSRTHVDSRSNTPISIIQMLIIEYCDEIYEKRRLTIRQRDNVHNILWRAFFEHADSNYFRKITNLSFRYWERVAKYKCLFLADNDEFYKLVERNWEILHQYSGDHLDIFYTPEELLVKGYVTADKLNIRNRIDQYPCLYLWHTSISEGKAIPVGDLECDDLLSLIESIIDDIVQKCSFDEIVQNAFSRINQMQQVLLSSVQIEKALLDNLFIACSQLQANPVVFGNATENQCNTQIRDLMDNLFIKPVTIGNKNHTFSIYDQRLQGRSSSGVSAGEIDLFVKLNQYPYAIIEALIVQGTGLLPSPLLNKNYIREHIQRIGKYDQNGLQRNIIIIYAKIKFFNIFYDSLINDIKTNHMDYTIGDNNIMSIEDISQDFQNNANLRIAKALYTNNGKESSLYFYVVRMEN